MKILSHVVAVMFIFICSFALDYGFKEIFTTLLLYIILTMTDFFDFKELEYIYKEYFNKKKKTEHNK